jgi:hypothetical protein
LYHIQLLTGQSSFVEELQDQQIQKGTPVTLTAKMSSTGADPKITWKKDGKVLGRGRARMTYEKGTATLKYVRTDYEDAGLYTVEIDTGSGVIESSANIEIAGMYRLVLARFHSPLSRQNFPAIFSRQDYDTIAKFCKHDVSV